MSILSVSLLHKSKFSQFFLNNFYLLVYTREVCSDFIWQIYFTIIRIFVRVVARDLPGGKRIRIINMRAQHITFNKAIKTVLKDCKEF